MSDTELPREAFHGTELLALIARFPNLTREEITAAVLAFGPKRAAIEEELERLSAEKA